MTTEKDIIEEVLKELDINPDWFYKQKSYLAGFTQALLKEALQSQKQKIIEEIENLPNPYPEDIFLPVSKEEYTAIHNLLLKHFNFPLDRLLADLMRIARENCKLDILKVIGEKQ